MEMVQVLNDIIGVVILIQAFAKITPVNPPKVNKK